MPWREVDPMDERLHFVVEHELSGRPIAELCRQYEISRKTGYKWLARYAVGGQEAMKEASRRPHSCPHTTPDWLAAAVVELKRQWPSWGPRKLAAKLRQMGIDTPAASTIGGLLKRAGLVEPRKRRPGGGVRRWPAGLTRPVRPNHVWGVDFKGRFQTEDGAVCHPLTVSDLYSRYILDCEPLADQKTVNALEFFGQLFARCGLPESIRVDNGPPFGSVGVAGLSRLSVMWLRLKIGVEFIAPGHPEQNGCHERMHRTLKAETARPPAATRAEQARRMAAWRREFNEERPHEALGQRPPAELYRASERKSPERWPDFEYAWWVERRRVRHDGMICWQGRKRFIGEAFAGSTLGLLENAAGEIEVFAGNLFLGVLIERGPSSLVPQGTRLDGPPNSGTE